MYINDAQYLQENFEATNWVNQRKERQQMVK
jgi:hypothetical protein